MLARWQRTLLFFIFCLAVVTFLSLEAYLLYSVIANGLSASSAIAGLFTTGALAGLAVLFKNMMEANFLKGDLLPPHKLRRFISERNRILEQARRSKTNQLEVKRNLITNTLKFAEETFHECVKGSHFEFCVFVDRDFPFLFSYYDTNGDETARSANERLHNPTYYADKGYEIVRVLRERSSKPSVISNTENTDYRFSSEEQKQQIRSTTLLSLDADHPCGLVVSSNAAGAFDEQDQRAMNLMYLVAELVKFDLFDDSFVLRLRSLRPELFPHEQMPIEEGVPISMSEREA